jgi:malonyl-CoA O-methyltransferase
MHIIGDILVKLGFTNPVTDLEYITIEYDSLSKLLADVRIVGAGSAVARLVPFTRQDYLELEARFDKLTNNGKIPLTLEVFYAHGWKDNINVDLPDGKKIIQFHAQKK